MVQAESVKLEWDFNKEPEVNKYRLFWGTESGIYTDHIDTDNNTTSITGLKEGVVYYFAVKALIYEESDFSEEINYKIPNPSCDISLCH